ncbi:Uncharacterised protein [Chryseobacterium gleum]|uniref:Uncharacterized protein n=2 Tax=Chryseobacterium gleum TaxID=250 RepID=A0A448AYL1_CHRGE|nr:hypothetical protein HMPREF0204_13552 [Chryseobacterium gleum ATCC 35910]VEE05345.1 Uncharacterised protein [Chryseobacterium gleum]
MPLKAILRPYTKVKYTDFILNIHQIGRNNLNLKPLNFLNIKMPAKNL